MFIWAQRVQFVLLKTGVFLTCAFHNLFLQLSQEVGTVRTKTLVSYSLVFVSDFGVFAVVL